MGGCLDCWCDKNVILANFIIYGKIPAASLLVLFLGTADQVRKEAVHVYGISTEIKARLFI